LDLQFARWREASRVLRLTSGYASAHPDA